VPSPELSHLVGKGIFGNLFNEPMAERIANPESTPNDPLGHRRQQPRIPLNPGTSALKSLAWRRC
jgi:hypothetical protein